MKTPLAASISAAAVVAAAQAMADEATPNLGDLTRGDPDLGLTVSKIADREGVHAGDVSLSLQLAFLAPDLVEGILDGTQPLALTAERLKRIGELPLLWKEQRTLLA